MDVVRLRRANWTVDRPVLPIAGPLAVCRSTTHGLAGLPRGAMSYVLDDLFNRERGTFMRRDFLTPRDRPSMHQIKASAGKEFVQARAWPGRGGAASKGRVVALKA